MSEDFKLETTYGKSPVVEYLREINLSIMEWQESLYSARWAEITNDRDRMTNQPTNGDTRGSMQAPPQ